MSKKLILILAITMIAMSQAGGKLAFDIAATRYTKGNDFWTVEVPCTGGSGQYKYSCELPDGWRQENNLFKIPSSCSTNYNFEYVVRCKVSDVSSKRSLERALIFKVTNSGYVLNDKQFLHGVLSAKSGMPTISGFDVLNRLNELTNLYSNSIGSISGNFGSLNGISGYSSGYFTGLPGWPDCDRYINDGNIAEILALVKRVADCTTMKCDAKIAWLNDLLGRFNTAIVIKNENIIQIQALISALTVQISKLEADIRVLETEQTNLGLEALKKKISELTSNLQTAYNNYNNCINNRGSETDLNNLKNNQRQLETEIERLRCSIDESTSSRTRLENEITELERRLANSKRQRDELITKITTDTATSNSKKTQLAGVKTRIDELTKQINDRTSVCSTYKVTYTQIETDLSNLNRQYNKGVARSTTITSGIQSMRVEIAKRQGQSKQYSVSIASIQQSVENLNGAILQIKQSISVVQYQCHDCRDVTIINNDVDSCFRFDRTSWINYMNRCYGAIASQIQSSFQTINIQIKVVTIFSSVFYNTYGACFGDQIRTRASQSNNQQTSLAFDGDFSCSSGFDSVVGRKGRIRAINSRFVDVDCDDGSQVRLKLGSCSRFEGQGRDFVPKVGHNIYFKGARNADSTFNLHTCSCY